MGAVVKYFTKWKGHMCFKPYRVYFKIICILILTFSGNAYSLDLSKHDFRNGDVLFQHLPTDLSAVILSVTHSRYSHCGMVVKLKGDIVVLEAIGPVKYTPVEVWVARGVGGDFTHYRPKGLTPLQMENVIDEAEKLLGRPYDILYEMDDEKIYCSELVYKAFLRGGSIRVGKEETLGSLDWKPHEAFIRNITGGELPLDRVMVTPESVSQSIYLRLVYSDFQ